MKPKQWSTVTKDIQRTVKKYGRTFEPAVLPADILRWPVGVCFDACALNTAKSDGKYQYVEGIATIKGETYLHAWMTDGTYAFDPTWQATDDDGNDLVPPVEYRGVIMPITAVALFMRMTGYQGLLANRWRLPDLVDDMLKDLKGVPDGSVRPRR